MSPPDGVVLVDPEYLKERRGKLCSSYSHSMPGAPHPLLSGGLPWLLPVHPVVTCVNGPVHTVVRTLASGPEQPCLMPAMGELMPCPINKTARPGTGRTERGSHFIDVKGEEVCAQG